MESLTFSLLPEPLREGGGKKEEKRTEKRVRRRLSLLRALKERKEGKVVV